MSAPESVLVNLHYNRVLLLREPARAGEICDLIGAGMEQIAAVIEMVIFDLECGHAHDGLIHAAALQLVTTLVEQMRAMTTMRIPKAS